MSSKKGKNKKPNKPPNLSPPQKLDNPVTQEKIEDLKDETVDSEAKDNERVPEIVSEVISIPTVEVKGQDVDTPKKPKRNRGKKKTQDKEDIIGDHQEEKAPEPLESDTNIKKIEVPQASLLTATVVPSARKKKNKKKCDESISEEPLLPERVVQEIKSETEFPDTLTTETNTKEQENAHAKKKNKKKHEKKDSEKAGKIEEITSCTTFSHSILDVEGEKSLEKNKQTETDELQLIVKESEVEIKPKFDNVIEKECLTQSKDTVSLRTEIATPKEDVKEMYKSESKDRKKNKKEKKNTPKPVVFETQSSDDLEKKRVNVVEETYNKACHSSLEVGMLETISQTDIIKEAELEKKVEIECSTIEKVSTKAKIVKPVDKKRKEKEDVMAVDKSEKVGSLETILSPEVSPLLQTEAIMDIQSQPASTKLDLTESKENIEPQKHLIMSDNTHDKKRSKSPNISEPSKTTIEKSINPLEQMAAVPIQVEGEHDIIRDEIEFESLVLVDLEKKPINDKLENIIEGTTQTYDIGRSEVSTDVTGVLQDSKSKQGKKKRKSPKTPVPTEIITEIKDETCVLQENIRHDEISQDHKTCKESISDLNLTSAKEIEIKVDKPENSDGLACDITPDVLYPRSISQQNLDDNNNMVIQEILVEDIINVPVVLPSTPLVEGSGETPIGTPEMIASGIRITEIETVATVKEEKTDLKSKMMEVNKDMEDLRLSIERSLAEFTAMEKSEASIEKQFEEKNTKEHNSIKIAKDAVLENILQKNISESINQDFKTNIGELASKSGEITSELIQTNTATVTGIVKIDAIIESGDTQQNIDELVMTTEQKPPHEINTSIISTPSISQTETHRIESLTEVPITPPIIPTRKDHKGKGKKRKDRQEVSQSVTTTQSTVTSETKDASQDVKKNEKTEQKSDQKSEKTQEKAKQQSNTKVENSSKSPRDEDTQSIGNVEYEPIESFEDALTSSADDVNQTFEIMVNDVLEKSQQELAANKPEINIIAPVEDTQQKQDKVHPVSQPKNLLGHPNIPVQSNKTDYKKEKNKTPNARQARVKIKDAVDVETQKQSKESQTDNKNANKILTKINESLSQDNETDDFIYKYSFRKVFLQSSCHICKKELKLLRVPCNYCNLVFYCSVKHKDEDWQHHQALCFAVSTIVHVKDQKFIYADAKGITGHNYRLLRMQMILSCEKVLKRRLVPWEQEALLYPRVCADMWCREWKQSRLRDCEGCGQISYCSNDPAHLPKSHQRWCKSYSLYQKLVTHQQTKGRLEPKLPSKVMSGQYDLPEKINEVLASMYEEKIDMNDIQYAALTQIATAPLTAAYCHQIYKSKVTSPTNGIAKKTSFTIHVVGVELQFEADALNKWEVFFLHLRPDVEELSVVLIGTELNPGNLPLELLGKIKLCQNCRQNKRRVNFTFQDKMTYQEYRNGDDFIHPDLVCAFNPSIQRASIYNGKDPWPAAVTTIIKLKSPFLVTAHTVTELQRDLLRIKDCADDVKVLIEPKYNTFASVRPDRNFISDDEMPLLFKNYCFMILSGA